MLSTFPCGTAVWSHVVTGVGTVLLPLLSIIFCYISLINSGIFVTYVGLTGTQLSYKTPLRPVEADSIVVKMLKQVSCSSCDGVHFKGKKGKKPTNQFNYLSRFLSPLSFHLTVPLKGHEHEIFDVWFFA